jgi:hypothetical protein
MKTSPGTAGLRSPGGRRPGYGPPGPAARPVLYPHPGHRPRHAAMSRAFSTAPGTQTRPGTRTRPGTQTRHGTRARHGTQTRHGTAPRPPAAGPRG